MYPHGRSLVAKFKGRPFEIVGVNTDSERALVKKVVAKEKITWRSFWDGGSTGGPIVRRWGIDGFPTSYLIDYEGKIVSEGHVGPEIDNLIEREVKKAEAAAKRAGG